MKILYVSYEDTIGRRFNGYDSAQRLHRQGHDTRMIVWQSNAQTQEPFVEILNSSGYQEVLTIAQESERVLNWQALIPPWYLTDLQESEHFDVVHLQIYYPYYLNLFDIAHLSRRVPLVITFHDFWNIFGHCIHNKPDCMYDKGCEKCIYLDWYFPLKKDKSSFLRKMKRELIAQSGAEIIVSNRWFKDKVIQVSDFPESRLHVLPFGIDMSIFKPNDKGEAKRRLGIDERRIVLSFRNALSNPFKNVGMIVEALAKLQSGTNVALLTIEDRTGLEGLKGKFPIFELGKIVNEEDIVTFYNATDIFISVSKYETFGMMAVEAMACGVPSIVTSGTPLPIVAHSPHASRAVAQDDSGALCRQLEELIGNQELRKAMGQKAREVALSEYSIEKHYAGLLQVYEAATKAYEIRSWKDF